jgi:hypothetical protein
LTYAVSYGFFCGIADKERNWQDLVDTGEDLIAQYDYTNEATNLGYAIEFFHFAAALGLEDGRDAAATFLRAARALIPNESSDNAGERAVQVPQQEMTLPGSPECERGCTSMYLRV